MVKSVRKCFALIYRVNCAMQSVIGRYLYRMVSRLIYCYFMGCATPKYTGKGVHPRRVVHSGGVSSCTFPEKAYPF